jgi:hypothetical protein
VPFSDDDDEYNERFVTDLLKRLDGPVHVPLSANEKALLVAIIEGTYEVSWLSYSARISADD